MRVAVLSDIHDNIWQLEKVLTKAAHGDALVFCGDFCFTLDLGSIRESALVKEGG